MSLPGSLLFSVAAIVLEAALGAQDRSLAGELPLRSPFAGDADPALPRPEYPRPQMVRDRFVILNGMWEWSTRPEGDFEARILVPFAPESALSGLMTGQRIHERTRYRRAFRVPEAWRGSRILLQFEAVDWEARVVVDGRDAIVHRGGYDPFGCDITDLLGPGPDHVVEVHVFDPADPARGGTQPRGKQLGSEGIWYTRTTGIWRSVWMEPVPVCHATALRLDAGGDGRLAVSLDVTGAGNRPPAVAVTLRGSDRHGRDVHLSARGDASSPVIVEVAEPALWSPDSPALYDLEIVLEDPGTSFRDVLRSYTAFRSVTAAGPRILLNGRPFFIRGVLDQGYWPESGLTAPSDGALRFDVELAKSLGLNLARKHVKVEDRRWYAWCDRLGLAVMQDMPESLNLGPAAARRQFEAELRAMVRTLRSHPSILHWVVFNEDWGKPGAFQGEMVKVVRGLDPTRPVTDASGWTQREDTDVTDVHDYGSDLSRHGAASPPRPRILGECGGVAYWREGHTWTRGWGYTTARSEGAFLRRIGRLIRGIHGAENLSGFVWTQLTDVEQELNGLVHYDRTPKVAAEKLRSVLSGNLPSPRTIAPAEWLVLGPLPAGTDIASAENSPGNREALGRALGRQWLQAETRPEPAEGDRVVVDGGTLAWTLVRPRGGIVDLALRFGGSPANCVAYAVGRFDLPSAARATLLFGSDDAARVFLDGRTVHEIVAVRGVGPADDEMPGFHLAAGPHTVVVKVAQGIGGFGFALEIELEAP